MKGQWKTWEIILTGILVSITGCLGCVFSLLVMGDMGWLATPTPIVQIVLPSPYTEIKPIPVISPFIFPTPQNKLDMNIPPTFTPTFEGGATLFPTFTEFPGWTPNLILVTPIPTKAIKYCSCERDLYNCSNFSSQRQAQLCFNYCMKLGYGDIHELDADTDGKACE